jgi:Chaperone of endosialidase
MAPPCAPNVGLCAPNSFCCGSGCCPAGNLCCDRQGPVSGGPPDCFSPTKDQPTCPQGCAPLCISDRNQKKNIAPVDAASILEKVSRLPISTWSYRSEPDGVRHLGPMAQDFRSGFGLGDDDRTYYAVDAQGVALAAIQALDRIVAKQQARIERLERENQELARRLRPPAPSRRHTQPAGR